MLTTVGAYFQLGFSACKGLLYPSKKESLIIYFCFYNYNFQVFYVHRVPRAIVEGVGWGLNDGMLKFCLHLSHRTGNSFSVGVIFPLPSTLLVPGKLYLSEIFLATFFSLLFFFPPWLFRNEASGEILCLSHFSRLGRAPEAEDLASQMLKGFPRDRVSAQEALVHNYFSVLPAQLHQLPDGEWRSVCVYVCGGGGWGIHGRT